MYGEAGARRMGELVMLLGGASWMWREGLKVNSAIRYRDLRIMEIPSDDEKVQKRI